MECGKGGHFKCLSERKSGKIKLKFKVRDNLDEFFVASKDSDINKGDSEDVLHLDVQSVESHK